MPFGSIFRNMRRSAPRKRSRKRSRKPTVSPPPPTGGGGPMIHPRNKPAGRRRKFQLRKAGKSSRMNYGRMGQGRESNTGARGRLAAIRKFFGGGGRRG